MENTIPCLALLKEKCIHLLNKNHNKCNVTKSGFKKFCIRSCFSFLNVPGMTKFRVFGFADVLTKHRFGILILHTHR